MPKYIDRFKIVTKNDPIKIHNSQAHTYTTD